MSKRRSPPRSQGRRSNDRRPSDRRSSGPRKPQTPKVEHRGARHDDRYWIYGRHAVLAALANPRRRCHRLLVSEREDPELDAALAAAAEAAGIPRPEAESCTRPDLLTVLPEGAVHQGLALRVSPLREPGLDIAWRDLGPDEAASVVVLDQATDPRNIGAILRSAAAFGARAVVVQTRHAPEETGTLAKAASGALERVPLVRVINLARAIEELKEAGFWCVGLDGRADALLGDTDPGAKAALVLGSEGSGLRRLVREACDMLARIPIAEGVESLNLSNAAAVALYDLARRHR